MLCVSLVPHECNIAEDVKRQRRSWMLDAQILELLEAGLPDSLVLRKMQLQKARETAASGTIKSRGEVVDAAIVASVRKKHGISWKLADSDEQDVLKRIADRREAAKREGRACEFRVYKPLGLGFDDPRAFGGDLVGDAEVPVDSQLIIIATDAMLRDARKYGKVLFTDATHCVSCKLGVKLISVMAVDEHGRGRHLVWAVVTTETTEVFKAIFSVLRSEVNALPGGAPGAQWTPTTLMTDMAKEAFLAARQLWPRVLSFFCIWHVLKSIKLNLRKRVTGNGADRMRHKLFNLLHAMCYHGEEASALSIMAQVRRELRAWRSGTPVSEHGRDMLHYLELHFFAPARLKEWALHARGTERHLLANGSCARVNMILEAWHSTLKTQIFSGKRNRWIGKLLLELLDVSTVFEYRRRVEAADFGTAPASSWGVAGRGQICTGFGAAAPESSAEMLGADAGATFEAADADVVDPVELDLDFLDSVGDSDEPCDAMDEACDAMDLAADELDNGVGDGNALGNSHHDMGGVAGATAGLAAGATAGTADALAADLLEAKCVRAQYLLRVAQQDALENRVPLGSEQRAQLMQLVTGFCAAFEPHLAVAGKLRPLRPLPADTRAVALRQLGFGARQPPPLRARNDDVDDDGAQPASALRALPGVQSKAERRRAFGRLNAAARRDGRPFEAAVCLPLQQQLLGGEDAGFGRAAAATVAAPALLAQPRCVSAVAAPVVAAAGSHSSRPSTAAPRAAESTAAWLGPPSGLPPVAAGGHAVLPTRQSGRVIARAQRDAALRK